MVTQPARRQLPRTIREHERIVVFDGICRLCCASFRFIYRRDETGAFRFATAQSHAGQEILLWCGLPTDHYATVVYIENGVVFQCSGAMLRILRHLPQPWPLLSLARFCPRVVRDGVYKLIARNRYRLFGKRDACLVPTEKLAARFL